MISTSDHNSKQLLQNPTKITTLKICDNNCMSKPKHVWQTAAVAGKKTNLASKTNWRNRQRNPTDRLHSDESLFMYNNMTWRWIFVKKRFLFVRLFKCFEIIWKWFRFLTKRWTNRGHVGLCDRQFNVSCLVKLCKAIHLFAHGADESWLVMSHF